MSYSLGPRRFDVIVKSPFAAVLQTTSPPEDRVSGLSATFSVDAVVRRTSGLLRRAGTTLLDVLYPPHCMACRTAVQGPRALCAACWASMKLIERPYCERLGVPFPHDLGPGLLSPEAIAHPPAYHRARAVACFDDGPVRSLIHALKYGDRPDYARVLGRWMARAGHELLADADIIVPVPLHRRRLWARRYNQAALLAQAVGRTVGRPVELQAIERVKPTASQVGMTRSARAANVQGAFRLSPETSLLGARVVLVDDVLTTGATANTAARVLLRGGAASVDLLVFAQVVTSA